MKAAIRGINVINYVLQMIVSNAAICLGLALIALIVGKTFKRPSITHLIWLLVLVKLLTPPVVNIPTFPVPRMAVTNSPAAFETVVLPARQDMRNTFNPVSPVGEKDSQEEDFGRMIQWKQLLFLAWLLGSGIVFAWSLSQAYRFHRLLQKESEMGNTEICEMAVEMASHLGLRKIPEIRMVSARVSPMVWWIGGKIKIVVPDVLLERIEAQELRWILAHELAHVRRRDFYIRWVEWLTCVLFWWYPVAWWARRNLRINEELCCDELVLSCLKPQPVAYGESLLKTVEFLSGSSHYKPILASGINSGELLKRRVRIILSNKCKGSNLRRMRACTLLGALVVLPLGLTSSQSRNQDIVQPRQEEATLPSSIMMSSGDATDVEYQFDDVLSQSREESINRTLEKSTDTAMTEAENGDAEAQSALGMMFLNGDYTEAAKWLRKAAEQGIAEAQYNLGVMYNKGQGVPQDYAESEKWLRKAAEQGLAVSQASLGRYYEDEGTPQDYITAYMWYDIAVSNGFMLAAGQRGDLTAKMTSEDIKEAQGRVWRCKQTDYKMCDPLPEGLQSYLKEITKRTDDQSLSTPQGGTPPPTAIPDGMRAISVRANISGRASDRLLPGARVDVIRTGPLPDNSKIVVSRIILENIQVLRVEQMDVQIRDGQRENIRVVTLLVTPEQAQKLILAGTNKIQLAVRN
jgi:beta-lactamase regulating signal transducer with metallopeptidase domain